MSGARPPLPLRAFMAWTLRLTFPENSNDTVQYSHLCKIKKYRPLYVWSPERVLGAAVRARHNFALYIYFML